MGALRAIQAGRQYRVETRREAAGIGRGDPFLQRRIARVPAVVEICQRHPRRKSP